MTALACVTYGHGVQTVPPSELLTLPFEAYRVSCNVKLLLELSLDIGSSLFIENDDA